MVHPSEMDPGGLLCLREELRLSISELARVLGLDARDAPAGPDEPALARSARKREPLNRETVRGWESGARPLSAPNAEALARLVAYTDAAVAALVSAHQPGRPIVIYASDADLHAAEPGLWPSLPASWHRAVASRAARETGGRIEYRGAREG